MKENNFHEDATSSETDGRGGTGKSIWRDTLLSEKQNVTKMSIIQ